MKMKLFTISHSNFIKVNSRNIDLNNFLGYIWKPEAYYKNQIFKDVWTKERPGLLRQYVAEVALNQAHQDPKSSTAIEVIQAMTPVTQVKLTSVINPPSSSSVQVTPVMTYPSSPVQVTPVMTSSSPVQIKPVMNPISSPVQMAPVMNPISSPVQIKPVMASSSPVQMTPVMTSSSPVQMTPVMTYPSSPVQMTPVMTSSSPVQ
ncbi:uncharacterized threonine-rich GPI-anchored glycoprotein PJ4664.02-like, partial [Mizuhopecten yessoensis]|uniref:uncharacterized threonine-rich GPI-anchored glycoprotein PJ4664.02-like n=1 Tax=Mizuhopecten yessoensis TaxID=6573 RepID=UPI000B459964